MTRDKKTGHYKNNVTQLPAPQGTYEDQAVAKLLELQQTAFKVRHAMDLCCKYITVERMVQENLPLEATIAYAARNKVTMMAAREVVAKMLAERAAPVVVSVSTDIAKPDNGVDR